MYQETKILTEGGFLTRLQQYRTSTINTKLWKLSHTHPWLLKVLLAFRCPSLCKRFLLLWDVHHVQLFYFFVLSIFCFLFLLSINNKTVLTLQLFCFVAFSVYHVRGPWRSFFLLLASFFLAHFVDLSFCVSTLFFFFCVFDFLIGRDRQRRCGQVDTVPSTQGQGWRRCGRPRQPRLYHRQSIQVKRGTWWCGWVGGRVSRSHHFFRW